MSDCIFCKIISGEYASSKVYEDDDCLAFLDIQPVNIGHVLVIPKIHKQFIHELDDELAGKLISVANRVNRALRKTNLNCEAVNYFLADGESAGQEVFHTHLHCFPRYKNDGFGLKFSKEYFTRKPDREYLNKVALEIKNLI
ncbi:MAG: HIT family protein [Candidatus Sericytochromatia bacterium]